ncbi:pentapeptide repeat-containing protein [Streptomyces sp. V4-01]|uniref:Pentapeptide repeat-containing protein n=1 Tax=Actinacidiphila polyblastidii TaxID=3110430 RepID=A0ABU7PL25_9ACTN|nr:pentapeptide repeat-containing protein [Streptomyces sp. V4-01]
MGAGIALLYTARNYRLAQRGQVTDRFTKALERLGSPEMYVRVGAVLALEQIVQDSPDQATNAAQILNAFIRHRVSRRGKAVSSDQARLNQVEVNADVQAALTALTRPASRRHVAGSQPIDLSYLELAHALLAGADLTRARLTSVNLAGADLTGADLSSAHLNHADLNHADLTNSRFCHADLTAANLLRTIGAESADFDKAILNQTEIDPARLPQVGPTP